MIMKNKKLFLPAIILAVAILVITVYSVVSSIAFKPTVVEGEFPFSITYELNGETITVSDVYNAYYVRNDGYADTKGRVYEGEIGNLGDDVNSDSAKNKAAKSAGIPIISEDDFIKTFGIV